MLRFIALLLAYFALSSATSMPQEASIEFLNVKINSTATLAFPAVANFRRVVTNPKTKLSEEHIYRVCNGKNKAKCGFWENVTTKKKVASGITNYNKKKKSLLIKKFQVADEGQYMTGNKKKYYHLFAFSG